MKASLKIDLIILTAFVILTGVCFWIDVVLGSIVLGIGIFTIVVPFIWQLKKGGPKKISFGTSKARVLNAKEEADSTALMEYTDIINAFGFRSNEAKDFRAKHIDNKELLALCDQVDRTKRAMEKRVIK